jgi:CRP-like cAMP-binding protein
MLRGDIMKLKDATLFKNTNIDLTNIVINQFPNNFTIALEGDKSEFIGVVLEGKLLIKTYSYGGKNFTLKLISEDGIFGDVLLYGNTPKKHPGSLITQGTTTLAMIPYKDFKNYIRNDEQLRINLLSSLCEKAYEMNVQAKLLSQDSIRDKILFWIQTQTRVQKSNTIHLNMSKEELANQLFIQRPSLSRELSKMKKDGLIDYDRKTITILQ